MLVMCLHYLFCIFVWATFNYASVCPSGPDRTPVVPQPSEPATMSSRRFRCHQVGVGLSGLVMLSDDEYTDDEDSDDEDSDASPSPPWRLEAAARWASLSHRLLVRQDIRNKHCFLKAALEHPNCDALYVPLVCVRDVCSVRDVPIALCGLSLKTYGRLLQTLRQHTDPLSARDIWYYIDGQLVNGRLVY